MNRSARKRVKPETCGNIRICSPMGFLRLLSTSPGTTRCCPCTTVGASFPGLSSVRANREVSWRTGIEGVDLAARANRMGCSQIGPVLVKEPHNDKCAVASLVTPQAFFSMLQSNLSAKALAGVWHIHAATRPEEGSRPHRPHGPHRLGGGNVSNRCGLASISMLTHVDLTSARCVLAPFYRPVGCIVVRSTWSMPDPRGRSEIGVAKCTAAARGGTP